MPATKPTYDHTQRGPLCLILYLLGPFLLGTGVFVWSVLPWQGVLFLGVGAVVLALGPTMHHLRVHDDGDALQIQFGPVPLFQRRLRYDEIVAVEPDRLSLLDGWGIQVSLRGGWVWSLWGWGSVKVQLRRGTLRIGTDEPERLAEFLQSRAA